MDELQTLAGEAAAVDAQVEALTPAAPADPAAAAEVTQAGAVVTPEIAMGEATLLCNLAADGAAALYPVLQYSEATRKTAAEKLAPVLAKYNLGSSFLARWQEEIDAGIFFATVIYQSYAQVKAAKAAEAARKEGPQLENQPA